MAEACDKLHLFFTFSCFTHMLACSDPSCGTASPVLLLPARTVLCLSTASHKSPASFSSWQEDRSPPAPKAENSHCLRVLPHWFSLCSNCSQNQAFISSPAQDRHGCAHGEGFNEHMGSRDFLSWSSLAAQILPMVSWEGGAAHPHNSPWVCWEELHWWTFSSLCSLKKLCLFKELLSLQASLYPEFYNHRW